MPVTTRYLFFLSENGIPIWHAMYKVIFLCIFSTELLVCIFGTEPLGSALVSVKKPNSHHFYSSSL